MQRHLLGFDAEAAKAAAAQTARPKSGSILLVPPARTCYSLLGLEVPFRVALAFRGFVLRTGVRSLVCGKLWNILSMFRLSKTQR